MGWALPTVALGWSTVQVLQGTRGQGREGTMGKVGRCSVTFQRAISGGPWQQLTCRGPVGNEWGVALLCLGEKEGGGLADAS